MEIKFVFKDNYSITLTTILRIVSLSIIIFVSYSSHLFAQQITATIENGGSVRTKRVAEDDLNENSSLNRTWLILNDPSCPAQLKGAGVKTKQRKREKTYRVKNYKYKLAGSLTVSEPISAIDIRFALFDVFGSPIKILVGIKVQDINDSKKLKKFGTFRAWEWEVVELFTVVSFVAQVRTQNGKIWRYNEQAILSELNKMHLIVPSGFLEPIKEK